MAYVLPQFRAGGFAIQGMGGLLIERIEGDYNNIVGFPGQVRASSHLDFDITGMH